MNGGKISSRKALIPLTSEAFLFGRAVFETMRTYRKILFRVEDHLKRLENSAKIIGLKLRWPVKKIKKHLEELICKVKWPESKIRIILTSTDLILMIEELQEKENSMYEKGVELVLYYGQRSLPEAKNLANIISYVAKEHAKQKKAYEAILIDDQGYVKECAYANIFWVRNGKLFTSDKGILKGITRQTIIELSDHCRFKEIKYKDLLSADEVFITQSSSGILPVVRIENSKIGNGKPGPIGKELMRKFKEKVWGAEKV